MTAAKTDFFDYFQLAGLALFLSVVVGRTLHLRIRQRINPITLNLGKDGILGIMELSLLGGVNLWVVAVLWYALSGDDHSPPRRLTVPWMDTMAIKVAGAVLIGVAFIIFVAAFVALGNSWRLGIDKRQPGKLVTGGIYALSRNPIYVFFDLYFIGTFLVNGALIFAVFAVLAIANLHYQILQEEKFLARIHGAAYATYCAQTARYLTWRRPA